MQIHLLQTDIHWEDPSRNIEALSALAERVTPAPNDLIVLPEMFSAGFSMEPSRFAEPSDGSGAASQSLTHLAQTHASAVIGGVAIRDADTFFNEALAALPDGSVARYRKHQTFSLAGESEAYSAGDRLTTFDWSGGRIGLSICYDLRFPEIYRA